MRLYQIIFKVPDNFNPDQMQLSASSKFNMEVCGEGFIGHTTFAECEETKPDAIAQETKDDSSNN